MMYKYINTHRGAFVDCVEIKVERPWPPNQVKAHRFVVYDVFERPKAAFENHVIKIAGMVEKPLEVPMRELAKRFQCVDVIAPFHCVTGWSIERVVWRGVQTKALLEEARPYGPYALAWGIDGYSASLPTEALMEDSTIVAWAIGGQPLPEKHGAPARLVVPTRYGWKSVKYFGGVEVLQDPLPGYWEIYGYSLNADPWREERLDFNTAGGRAMGGRKTSF